MTNITAIVIDDEKDIAGVFAEYLQMIDVDVLGVGFNGKDAVEIYEKHRPDIVFSDLMMPDYDGLYALENIRNIDPQANVIIITAFMHSVTAKLLLSLHPTKVISKPCDLSMIRDVVNQFRSGNTQLTHRS